MARIRAGFQLGTITSNPLGAGSTSIASDQFAALPEIVAPDYLVLVLDPESAFGAREIVHVTAHAPAATTVTVTRGSAITEPEGDKGTVSREHPVNTVWRHGATVGDYGDENVTISDTEPTGVTAGHIWVDISDPTAPAMFIFAEEA